MRSFWFAVAIASVAGMFACGARSSILDEPGVVLSETGGAAQTAGSSGSTSSGPFAVTSAGAGGGVSGNGGAASGTTGTTAGSGATGSSSSGVMCQGGGLGPALSAACSAYACELENSGGTACASCLNEAVLTTCANEIHRATSNHHHCRDANMCAEMCSGADLCGCVIDCMQGEPPHCANRWADAFWCVSGACASVCSG